MKKFILNLEQKSSLLKCIFFYIVFYAVTFFINGDIIGVEKLLEITGGVNILDFEYAYSTVEAYKILAGLGEVGRGFYLSRILPMDFVFPLSYMLFYLSALLFLLKNLNIKNTHVHLIAFIPVLAAISDFIENVMIILMLNAYPEQLNAVSIAASIFATVKMLFIVLIIGSITLLALINIFLILKTLIKDITQANSIKGAFQGNKYIKIIVLLTLLSYLVVGPLGSLVVKNVEDSAYTSLQTNEALEGKEISVSVRQGEHYFYDEGSGIFSRLTNPQMAIWTEDKEGNFLETLYITKKAGTSGWGKDKNRAAALPYWSHRQKKEYEVGSYMPTTDEPVSDAIGYSDAV